MPFGVLCVNILFKLMFLVSIHIIPFWPSSAIICKLQCVISRDTMIFPYRFSPFGKALCRVAKAPIPTLVAYFLRWLTHLTFLHRQCHSTFLVYRFFALLRQRHECGPFAHTAFTLFNIFFYFLFLFCSFHFDENSTHSDTYTLRTSNCIQW